MRHGRKQIRLNTTDKNKEQVDFVLPCEQRLHFRGMSWRAKSSHCQQRGILSAHVQYKEAVISSR